LTLKINKLTNQLRIDMGNLYVLIFVVR